MEITALIISTLIIIAILLVSYQLHCILQAVTRGYYTVRITSSLIYKEVIKQRLRFHAKDILIHLWVASTLIYTLYIILLTH